MAVERPSLSIEDVFRAVVDKQVSPENVAVMKELLAMSAERKFAEAFAGLQSELPVIVATTIIPNRGKYERYEDILKVVQPLMTKYAFTVSFSQDYADNPVRIIETCHLTHGGFTQSNKFAVRCGRADTETQADCKAATTAKRNAFCNAINVIIRQDMLNSDDDATILGDPNAKVTAKQAEEIEHRAKMVNAKIPDLLKFAGAATFADIPARRYDEIDTLLTRKEKGR